MQIVQLPIRCKEPGPGHAQRRPFSSRCPRWHTTAKLRGGAVSAPYEIHLGNSFDDDHDSCFDVVNDLRRLSRR